MAQTLILKCTCEQGYQDSQYGTGSRLHKWDEQSAKWICSACGNEKDEKPKKAPKK